MTDETMHTAEYLMKAQQMFAMIIAKTIRDGLEELHGGGIDDPENGLTDAQMAKINPILRDGAVTALTLMESVRRGSQGAANILNWKINSLPSYWEEPELLEGYAESLNEVNRGMASAEMMHPWVIVDRATCKNCNQPIFLVRGEFGKAITQDQEKWKHQDIFRTRSCRGASYDDDGGGYDNSLPKTANATPKRGWKPA